MLQNISQLRSPLVPLKAKLNVTSPKFTFQYKSFDVDGTVSLNKNGTIKEISYEHTSGTYKGGSTYGKSKALPRSVTRCGIEFTREMTNLNEKKAFSIYKNIMLSDIQPDGRIYYTPIMDRESYYVLGPQRISFLDTEPGDSASELKITKWNDIESQEWL